MSTREVREEARRAIAKELDRIHRKRLKKRNDQVESVHHTPRRLMHRLRDVHVDRYFN